MDELFLLSGFVGGYVFFLGLILLVQILGFFFLGLMFYFFIGDKSRGDKLVSRISRLGIRIYSHFFQMVASILGFIALATVIKVVFGAILDLLIKNLTYPAGFVEKDMIVSDIKFAIVLTLVSTFIFIFHYLISSSIESAEEKKGTIATKLIWISALITSGFILVGSVTVFLFEVVSLIGNGLSNYGPKPGATLAVILGILPVWFYYYLKVSNSAKAEKA